MKDWRGEHTHTRRREPSALGVGNRGGGNEYEYCERYVTNWSWSVSSAITVPPSSSSSPFTTSAAATVNRMTEYAKTFPVFVSRVVFRTARDSQKRWSPMYKFGASNLHWNAMKINISEKENEEKSSPGIDLNQSSPSSSSFMRVCMCSPVHLQFHFHSSGRKVFFSNLGFVGPRVGAFWSQRNEQTLHTEKAKDREREGET